jgi:hypothetical protein
MDVALSTGGPALTVQMVLMTAYKRGFHERESRKILTNICLDDWANLVAALSEYPANNL